MDQEFEGCYSCDEVRTELLLSEQIKDREHVLAKFSWGNIKSIGRGVQVKKDGTISKEDEAEWDSLWQDVKAFYNEYYSADRIFVVVQAIIPPSHSLKDIEQWVTDSFSHIKNKNYGLQDFSIKPSTQPPQKVSWNVYEETLGEMIL